LRLVCSVSSGPLVAVLRPHIVEASALSTDRAASGWVFDRHSSAASTEFTRRTAPSAAAMLNTGRVQIESAM
jgi:hypothetical protein